MQWQHTADLNGRNAALRSVPTLRTVFIFFRTHFQSQALVCPLLPPLLRSQLIKLILPSSGKFLLFLFCLIPKYKFNLSLVFHPEALIPCFDHSLAQRSRDAKASPVQLISISPRHGLTSLHFSFLARSMSSPDPEHGSPARLLIGLIRVGQQTIFYFICLWKVGSFLELITPIEICSSELCSIVLLKYCLLLLKQVKH
jgi:hypothetical protein